MDGMMQIVGELREVADVIEREGPIAIEAIEVLWDVAAYLGPPAPAEHMDINGNDIRAKVAVLLAKIDPDRLKRMRVS